VRGWRCGCCWCVAVAAAAVSRVAAVWRAGSRDAVCVCRRPGLRRKRSLQAWTSCSATCGSRWARHVPLGGGARCASQPRAHSPCCCRLARVCAHAYSASPTLPRPLSHTRACARAPQQVQLDGTVRSSGTGTPPWGRFLGDLPTLDSVRTQMTDGIGPSI
jgi:hypothetical protein